MAGRCIFCGSAPTTNAHIFRKGWFEELFPEKSFRHKHLRYEKSDPLDNEWRHPKVDFKVKCVCQPCNGGWMDCLDRDAERIFLTAAALGHEQKIAKTADKAVISRWCILIASLFDNGQAVSRLSKNVHRALFEGQMPERAKIWLAHTQPSAGEPSAFALVKDLVLDSSSEPSQGVNHGDAYFITFGVRHLVVQVLIPVEGTPEGIKFNRVGSAGFIRQLWPDLFTSLVWPPPQTIPSDQIQDFARSFQYSGS